MLCFVKFLQTFHENTWERARTHVDLGSNRRSHEMSRKILQNLTETSFPPVFFRKKCQSSKNEWFCMFYYNFPFFFAWNQMRAKTWQNYEKQYQRGMVGDWKKSLYDETTGLSRNLEHLIVKVTLMKKKNKSIEANSI